MVELTAAGWLNPVMRARGLRFEQFLLGLMLLLALCWNLAEAREVKSVAIRDSATGTRAEIFLDSRAEYRVIPLANPDRLVLDVLDTGLSPKVRLPAGGGVVKAVRSGSPEPGVTRIVFDLASPVVVMGPNLEWRDGSAVLVLVWPDDGTSGRDAATEPRRATADTPAPPKPVEAKPDPKPAEPVAAAKPDPAPASPQPDPAAIIAGKTPAADALPTVKQGSGTVATGVPTRVATGVPAATPTPTPSVPVAPPASDAKPVRSTQDLMRNARLRPLVIAIDAGHGGQDTGAIGAAGTREKDLTLKVARELARQVDAMPGMKAYLTRDADFFIPLEQRYKKARAAKADVFISIHADAFINPQANGSSVWVLSQRGSTSQAARWLADRENAADLVGGVRLKDKSDTLASVLLDLSQSATQRASEAIAKDVHNGLSRIGRTHKKEIERANFVVLRSPDVPSMLVETAFISNPDEERRLNDPDYQRRIARAVLDGIHNYFSRMPPPGTWYAAKRSGTLGSVDDEANAVP